jgi:hypothetical protein
MPNPTDYSRSLRLAGNAARSDEQGLRDRLEATRIHITAEVDQPAISQALLVLIADLRRLPVQLSFDPHGAHAPVPDALVAEVQATADGIDPDRRVRIGHALSGSLHLHLGAHPPTTATISAVPDGHGVRLRRRGHPYPRLNSPGTGLGAVETAATLTAEAFKTITGLPGNTYTELQRLDFCPATLENNPGIVTARHPLIENTALIGAGAIGTGIALILNLLSATGTLTVVDPEPFDEPNVTTYSLGTLHDAAAHRTKVKLIAGHLPDLDVLGIHGTAQDLIDRIDADTAPWPHRVLGALDTIEARHDIQRIHADLTLDGSTGGQAGTTLALHEAAPYGPCLRCYYPVPRHGVSAEQLLHENTGLPLELIARGDRPLSSADLAERTSKEQARLAPYLGQPICGLSRISALTGRADDFRPSAAFVAQQAACLVVGALIARTTGHVTGPLRRAEYDTRFGPRPDMTDNRRPNPTCTCQTDSNLTTEIRTHRGAARTGSTL